MTHSEFNDSMTLKEVRDRLRELAEEGHRCPCCTQMAKIYRRKIHASMAVALIRLYRLVGVGEWVEIAKHLTINQNADAPKLRYWGLIEEEARLRPDGGRAGWWRITPAGEEWVMGRSAVPKYARIFDTRCLGMVGEHVGIKDALGTNFDYGDLMAGV